MIRETIGFRIFNGINYIFFVGVGVLMLYPFWYVLMYSLSDSAAVSINESFLLPSSFTLAAYEQVFQERTMLTGLLNSLLIACAGTAINLLLTALTAYPLSRGSLTGRMLLFGFITFTLLFHGGIIPTYLVVRSYHLVNTYWSVMLPTAVNVYNLLVMMKFFKNIPDALIESARIDGANDIGVFFKIVARLSAPVFAAIGLFYAVYHWNDFFQAMLYLNDKDKWPLQLVLRQLLLQSDMLEKSGSLGGHVSSESFKMAAVIVTVTPIVLVYPFLQKYFIKGIMLGSVKG
ncbi:MAG: carbohydrate ABC transporter permease [Paenibacillaceae bacterium]|nr:carbohydrate ABC transporter permease [Paenibacillaceae bacterium]